MISSDTLEDSVRLTIPAGLAARPGGAPASQTTVPTAPTGTNAVSITVGIEAQENRQIFDLNSLSHHANITSGFSDKSFKTLSPAQKSKQWKKWKSYVEFTSDKFLRDHFVLVWTVDEIDTARCIVEQLSPPIAGKPETWAVALTLVSNAMLDVVEHEYIFLVDHSGSMSGSRSQTAHSVVKTMLTQLPTRENSTFNIYNFNTSAWSILPGGKSIGYDTNNVSTAVSKLTTNVSGGTNIDAALTTVLGQRDTNKKRCSIIVISDGLDWGVTAAMQTVQKNVAAAAAQSNLLRVFVLGVGDDVSRGMCEGLARAGMGATAYISESQLQDHDHRDVKARTLINGINRAPIRVRSIDWGMTPNPTKTGASGENLGSRPQPNPGELGAAAKGDNLPPPKAIQQAPLPGTMFWAVRSYWYAIIDGNLRDLKAKITYDIPGTANSTRSIEPEFGDIQKGRLIHSLAARALIQGFEDKAASITDSSQKYTNECEIVRLGKTYGLASTQTSFVATMNGVGTLTNASSNAPPDGHSLLAGVSLGNTSNLSFVDAQSQESSTGFATFSAASNMRQPTSFAVMATNFAVGESETGTFSTTAAATPLSGKEEDNLSKILAAQDGNGAFDTSTVEQIVFPGTGIPAVPAFISTLDGRDNVKDQVWQAICVIAFFQKKLSERSGEWADAKAKAETFVKTTLCCIFGVESERGENILTSSLDDAEGYFF